MKKNKTEYGRDAAGRAERRETDEKREREKENKVYNEVWAYDPRVNSVLVQDQMQAYSLLFFWHHCGGFTGSAH